MAQKQSGVRSFGWPVGLALLLLVLVLVGFLVAVAASGTKPPAATPEPVSADSYRDRVATLLALAKPEDAEAVIAKYGCAACHREGAANGVAPSWEGIAERAATRRPPMPADAYLYESIVHPDAYLVEGFPDLMPKDFAQRMSDQELADVLAYLLTRDAH